MSVIYRNNYPSLALARGTDNAFWYRGFEEDEWASDWERLGGDFITHPAFVSLPDSSHVIFGITSDRQVHTKILDYYKGWRSG